MRLWIVSLPYFCIVIAFYGISFWLPQILKRLSGRSDLVVGFGDQIVLVLKLLRARANVRAGLQRLRAQNPDIQVTEAFNFVDPVEILRHALDQSPKTLPPVDQLPKLYLGFMTRP